MRRTYIKKLNTQLELPFQASDEYFLKEIFEILKKKFKLECNSNQRFIDLGSGDGSVIINFTLRFKLYSIGIEINKNLIIETKERIKNLKKSKQYERNAFRKIKLKNEDIFEQNLEDFDFIYIYSLPTMQKYLQHVFKTAKKGAVIISYKYPLNGFDSFLELSFKLDLEKDEKITSVYYYTKFI